MAPRSRTLVLVLALSSCKPVSGGGFRPQVDACAEGTETSWENTGRPIILSWCLPCHSQVLEASERQGAPEGVNFDDYEAVLGWAERIGARATASGGMPPMGGVPEADLDALQEWLACDLPGGTTVAPAFCEAPAVLEAPPSASDLACDTAVAIEGDLQVDVEADLDCVCSVSGDLIVAAPVASFSHLESVEGTIRVTAPEVIAVSLPVLTEAGALQLSGSGLSVLDLSELRSVAGEVEVSGLATLDEILLPELASVGASMHVENVDATRLVIDRLATVGGGFVVRDAPRLAEIRGTRSLSALGGDLVLETLPALASVDDFAELAQAPASVVLRDLGAVSVNGFHRLVQVDGDVVVENCSGLLEARGFPDLERVGGALIWRVNPVVTTWEGLNYLVDIGGDLRIEENAVLEALPSIQRLEHVGGDFVVRDNPQLPTVSAENVAAQVDIDGDVEISGNL